MEPSPTGVAASPNMLPALPRRRTVVLLMLLALALVAWCTTPATAGGQRGEIVGHVTDASGQGWPLYAHVVVPGTALETWTDPVTGAYQLALPDGHSYPIEVTAAYPGYQPRTDTVQVDDASTHDVGLSVDAAACSAPGYGRVGGLQESFDDGTMPAGWSVEDPHDTGVLWRFDDPGDRGNRTGGEGGFATIDSVTQHDHLPDTYLVSPAVDLAEATDPAVEFATDLSSGWPAVAAADLSLDGGATWSTVWSTQDPIPGPQTVSIPVPQAAGASAVRLRLHYKYGPNGWYWQADDVFIGDQTCGPRPAGLVVGHTLSTLTGTPLDDVDVTIDGSQPGVTSRADDGFYWMVAKPGSHQLTASTPDYADGSAQLQLGSGQVASVDLGLASGRLAPDPAPIRAIVHQGETTTRELTVRSTGDAPATFTLEELQADNSFSRHTVPSTAGTGSVQRVAMEISPLPDHDRAPTRSSAGSSSGSSSGTSAGTSAGTAPARGSAWSYLAPYPVAVRDTAAGTLHGVVYSFGGSVAEKAVRSSFRYDGRSDRWVPLADLPQPRQKPAGAFIGGSFIVAGGWGGDEQPAAQTLVYDPAHDT